MFRKLTLLAVLLTLLTIALGAYVRVTDTGFDCANWPGCSGTAAFNDHSTALPPSANGRALMGMGLWLNAAVHRYLAGIVGIAILIMSVSVWNLPQNRIVAIFLTMASMSIMILQILLGMWALGYQLLPLAITGHLMLGFAILALLYWLYLATDPVGIRVPAVGVGVRWLARAGLFVLLIQLAVGGWTSTHNAGLACPDFPTCNGELWPAFDYREGFDLSREFGPREGVLPLAARGAIQWAHRATALVASLLLIALAIAMCSNRYPANFRKAGVLIIVFLATEIGLGIALIQLQLPVGVSTAHTAIAGLLLLAVVYANVHVSSLPNRAPAV